MICDKEEISKEGKFLVPLSITRIFELSKWEWDPRMCLFIMLLIEKGIPDIMQGMVGAQWNIVCSPLHPGPENLD